MGCSSSVAGGDSWGYWRTVALALLLFLLFICGFFRKRENAHDIEDDEMRSWLHREKNILIL